MKPVTSMDTDTCRVASTEPYKFVDMQQRQRDEVQWFDWRLLRTSTPWSGCRRPARATFTQSWRSSTCCSGMKCTWSHDWRDQRTASGFSHSYLVRTQELCMSMLNISYFTTNSWQSTWLGHVIWHKLDSTGFLQIANTLLPTLWISNRQQLLIYPRHVVCAVLPMRTP